MTAAHGNQVTEVAAAVLADSGRHAGATYEYSSHDFIGDPNVLTWLLGREPTTFEQFVRKELNALTGS